MSTSFPVTDLPDEVIQRVLSFVGETSAITLFHCKCLCKIFRDEAESPSVYRAVETEGLWRKTSSLFARNEFYNKCRRHGNLSLMLQDGMVKYFYSQDESEGKHMIERAAASGLRDAKFVQAMLLMSSGFERRQEAFNLLNEAYNNSVGTLKVQDTFPKVQRILSRDMLRPMEFSPSLQTCPVHAHRVDIFKALLLGEQWLLGCRICLWEACYIWFKNIWNI